jgi:hypothetical protein
MLLVDMTANLKHGQGGHGGMRLAMIHLRIPSTIAFVALAMLANRSASAEPRAVIELFTSQGCSSCPPADKLAAEYARDPSVIMMSLAVDYWDYLGWKDTLALTGHSNRQRAYAKVRGDRQVYTPQAVVDGAAYALGSDKAAIEQAIRKERQQSDLLTLPVTVAQEDDKLTITVAASKDAQGQAEVWLCPITKSVPVVIGRGENSGHTITYTNVVRRWIKLGDWTGKAETFSIPVKDFQTGHIDSAAVVVQAGVAAAPRQMLGGAQIAIR